ncbi:MAG: hypothetical protein A3H51_01010 [Candidatus Spechtbacteria bacterium RIFCSPLOWO2_02_FULL_38_8]|uniref:Uncharacterized protein n=1 Tax=Candidatus Spechtbacteria bacterium RIFCSPLOWO2_02_FULL_38_8 TaxID=1802164 RepID=A0A1G2HKV8_9BACT|nr:MAG: hypothetical protein A3H51_01010 [Candidatus Spechtbacteria bacterium RIFCSPLOWO2_02_FULL_38_8]
MFNIALNKYIQAFDQTPKELKDVLFADYTSEAIKNSAHRYNAEDKLLDISATIGYILVGLIPVKNMIQVIQEEADLDMNTAKSIAYEIREQLFGPIVEILAKIQESAQKNWQEIKGVSWSSQPVAASAGSEADHSVVRPYFEKSNRQQTAAVTEPKINSPQEDVVQNEKEPPPPPNLPTGAQFSSNVHPDNYLDLRNQ